MSRERYAYSSAHAQAKTPTQRVVVAVLLVTGVTLLVLAKAQHPTLLAARGKMLDMTRPVLSALSQPVSASKELASDTRAIFTAAEDNKRLSAENDTLRHWQSVAMSLKAENESLRGLMGYQPVERVSYTTAKIIGSGAQAFGSTLIINAGAEDGIAALQPVIDAYGLVGRVVEVAKHTSRVMLLSDVGSRVPVITGTSRQRAILAGTGSDMLRLSFAEAESFTLGEPVTTTEEAGLIPGGIAVGSIFKRDAQGYLVKPQRSLTSAEYVRVIQSN